MAELRDLPPGLRVYLLAVIAVGTTLVGLVAATGPASLDGSGWARAALLLALGALAERFTLHLSHKTAINVSTAAALAAVLVFPLAVPGALVAAAATLGQLARRNGNPIEACFNASCRGLAALGAALVYHAVRDLPYTGPDVAGFGGLGALIATVAAAYAVTTLAVAVAAGLQFGTNPLRIVAVTLGDDAAPEAAMTVMAIPVAVLTL